MSDTPEPVQRRGRRSAIERWGGTRHPVTIHEIRERARAFAPKALQVLQDIAEGKQTAGTRTVTTFPDGRQQISETAPGPKDRAAAAAALLKYAGLEPLTGRSGGQGDRGTLLGAGGDILKALLAALSDPAVRKWLEKDQPETLQALKLLSAKPVEVLDAATTASVVPSSGGVYPEDDGA